MLRELRPEILERLIQWRRFCLGVWRLAVSVVRGLSDVGLYSETRLLAVDFYK